MALDELHKYEKAYRLDTYRMGPYRREVMYRDVGEMRPGSRYLDVGCGRGETLQQAAGNGVEAWGTEIVESLCGGRVVRADIESLPWPADHFDYVTCYDVLEHLTPGTEQRALDELFRVCRGQIIVTTNKKPSRLPSGEDLHVNKREAAEWQADILARCADGDRVFFKQFGPAGSDWYWRVVLA